MVMVFLMKGESGFRCLLRSVFSGRQERSRLKAVSLSCGLSRRRTLRDLGKEFILRQSQPWRAVAWLELRLSVRSAKENEVVPVGGESVTVQIHEDRVVVCTGLCCGLATGSETGFQIEVLAVGHHDQVGVGRVGRGEWSDRI